MQILHFETIDSTNTYSLKHFDELEDMSIITADTQTAGRGRFQRQWISKEKENLYLTFVLKPDKKEHLANLTQYLCVVIAKVIESYDVQTQIKWPNDVLIKGKKISGILCESSLKQNKIQGVVLGVGINLNMSPKTIELINKPATSLNLETGFSINKNDFQNKIIQEFFLNYSNLVEKGFDTIKNDYKKRIDFIGEKIIVTQRDNAPKEEYIAQDIDNLGNLIVKDSKGLIKTLFSGDLIL